MPNGDEIRDGQRATWAGLSSGREKSDSWHEVAMFGLPWRGALAVTSATSDEPSIVCIAAALGRRPH